MLCVLSSQLFQIYDMLYNDITCTFCNAKGKFDHYRKFVTHMKNHHKIDFDLEILHALQLMREDEKEKLVEKMRPRALAKRSRKGELFPSLDLQEISPILTDMNDEEENIATSTNNVIIYEDGLAQMVEESVVSSYVVEYYSEAEYLETR